MRIFTLKAYPKFCSRYIKEQELYVGNSWMQKKKKKRLKKDHIVYCNTKILQEEACKRAI